MIAHAAHLDPNGLWSNLRGGLNFNPGLTLDAAAHLIDFKMHYLPHFIKSLEIYHTL
jgi:hypothetical protein